MLRFIPYSRLSCILERKKKHSFSPPILKFICYNHPCSLEKKNNIQTPPVLQNIDSQCSRLPLFYIKIKKQFNPPMLGLTLSLAPTLTNRNKPCGSWLQPLYDIRARIRKRFKESIPMNSKKLIPPAHVAWRAGTSNRLFIPVRNRFLGSLKGLQIRALGSLCLPDNRRRDIRYS